MSIRSLALLSKNLLSTFEVGSGMASDKGTAEVAANEYVNLDRRQSSSAIGRGSMPTPGPPRGFISVTVKIPVVQPADRDCVFIAHLSAESTGLSKPNVMGLGWRAAAHNARLSPDELAVLLVAQANGFAAMRRRRALALSEGELAPRPRLHLQS